MRSARDHQRVDFSRNYEYWDSWGVFITLFIIVELKVKQPMLDLRLLKEPVFRKMSLISLFSSAGLLGMLFVFPLMYQNVIGVSALESGLTTFPEAIGLMISSQIVPWSYKN